MSLVSCPRNSMSFAAGQLFFKARAMSISKSICKERATRKNSQPAVASWVAMKMGRRLRCSSFTSRPTFMQPGRDQEYQEYRKWSGMRPLTPVRLGPPCLRPILIVTKGMLFRGQDTRFYGRENDYFNR
jgi:hypothetical protein